MYFSVVFLGIRVETQSLFTSTAILRMIVCHDHTTVNFKLLIKLREHITFLENICREIGNRILEWWNGKYRT